MKIPNQPKNDTKYNEVDFCDKVKVSIDDKELDFQYQNRYEYNFIKRKIIEHKYHKALDEKYDKLYEETFHKID